MLRCRWAAAVLLIAAISPTVAAAHPSGLGAGDAWWQAWHFDPLVALNVLLLATVYAVGIRRVWRRGGIGRGIACWQAAAFIVGLLAVLLALMSPLDTLGNDLSWVHMTQHMVLMVVAAPLLIVGAPGLAAVWAMPQRWRRAVGRWPQRGGWQRALWNASWSPLLVWSLHAVVLWGWHLPALYEWALVDPLVHDLEHLSFFLAACLFWRVAIDRRRHWRLNPALCVAYLFTTSLHATVLGVFMALSPRVWYGVYVDRTQAWQLSPLEDQQLAGLIMWMPACTTYALAAAVVFAAWLAALDQREASVVVGGAAVNAVHTGRGS